MTLPEPAATTGWPALPAMSRPLLRPSSKVAITRPSDGHIQLRRASSLAPAAGAAGAAISLGGNSSNNAKLGKILGRAVPSDDVATTIQKIIDVYLEQRVSNENEVEGFGELVNRIGIAPFKEKVYG